MDFKETVRLFFGNVEWKADQPIFESIGWYGVFVDWRVNRKSVRFQIFLSNGTFNGFVRRIDFILDTEKHTIRSATKTRRYSWETEKLKIFKGVPSSRWSEVLEAYLQPWIAKGVSAKITEGLFSK